VPRHNEVANRCWKIVCDSAARFRDAWCWLIRSPLPPPTLNPPSLFPYSLTVRINHVIISPKHRRRMSRCFAHNYCTPFRALVNFRAWRFNPLRIRNHEWEESQDESLIRLNFRRNFKLYYNIIFSFSLYFLKKRAIFIIKYSIIVKKSQSKLIIAFATNFYL